jgi:hypothetical protein
MAPVSAELRRTGDGDGLSDAYREDVAGVVGAVRGR